MNSMLRQHHLRIPDVKAYLRVFDKNQPSSPTDWAAQESMLYEPGYLIFCLEQVAAPAGLSTFSKKAEDQGETFRVKDLCVVISKDEGQCMVVNVTASAYEFRVLDALMQEKATKAILDGKDFNYLACRPITRLGPNQVKALYQVGSNYAQGGSRRSLTVEGSPLEEPVIALLGQLGSKLATQVGKPVIDIGSVCHMIFTPEGRQDDKNKTVLKACFAPLKAEELALGELAVQHGIMTQQAINAEQAASPAQFENNPFTPTPAEKLPEPQPAVEYTPVPVAPPASVTPAASSQSNFDIPPALQQISYSNLQLPPQSEIVSPFQQESLTGNTDPAYSFDASSAFEANPAFVPSTPAPAPEMPSATTYSTGRYDDTPPWATASADALTAVLMSGDNRLDQQLTTVKMAPQWYEMSHDTRDISPAAVEPIISPVAKEDFSAQFFNDYQQGFAGEAAIGYAESEFDKERRIREEQESGKEARLKDYFGDEHYDKFVKGDAPAPAANKLDSWDLDPNTYSTAQEEPIKETHFDSPIFSNAARGTIETNPEAILPEPPPVEVLAEPDAWMDYQPEPAAPAEAPDAVPQVPAVEEHAQGWGSSSPTDWHAKDQSLASLIEPTVPQATSEAEWSTAVESSFAQPAPLEESSSLFDRLTQQLSKDSPVQEVQMSTPVADEESQQVWHQGTPVSESAPVDSGLNKATDAGGFWSSMDPSTSLFNAPEEDQSVTVEAAPEPAFVPGFAPEFGTVEAAPETTQIPVPEIPASEIPVSEISAPPAMAAPQETAPEATPAQDNMSDSQVMQTRVRPRDYTSPLRRSSEIGGTDSASPPLQVPSSTPSLSPLRPQVNVPAPGFTSAVSASPTAPAPATSEPSAQAQISEPFAAPEPTPMPEPLAPEAALAESILVPESLYTAPEPLVAQEPTYTPEPANIFEPAAAAPEPAYVAPEPVLAAPVIAQPVIAQPVVAPPVVAPPVVASQASPAPVAEPAEEAPSLFPPATAASSSLYRSAPMGEFDSGVRKAPPAQDARLMMNEMATLMSKLEQQVAKAANKMSSRAEELKIRLNRQVEELLREGQDLEKHAEVNLTNLSSELRSRLDSLAVDVQNSLSKETEGGRSLLSDLDATGLERLESEQRQLSAKILRQCDEFRNELDKLTTSVQGRLNNLIASRNDELAKLSESILEQLKESHDSYSDKVTQRFERFRERMGEENSSITQSLERNMRSMVEEIDSSLDRACEKLRSTKLDLEQTISHTVAVCEMAVAQKTKQLLADTLLPKLNEQKEILRTMIYDMGKQVSTESGSALIGELAKLDSSISTSSESLKRSVEDCLNELENSGRGLKSGLEETFKKSSQELVQRTQEVTSYIKDTERRMLESDLTLKSLAESSTVDAEPELNEERNHALSKLGSLKQQANKDLASAIENSIERMENESEKLFGELTVKRADLTATVRDSAETNLDRVRQALAAATAAIQAAREKHME